MPLQPALSDEFVAITQGRVRFAEPMRLHTTFHIGGPAEIWAEPQDEEELCELLKVAREGGLALTLIGGGANLLVRDEGIPGLVIHLGNPSFQRYQPFDELRANGVEGLGTGMVVAGAGLPLEWLIRKAGQGALSGVEFLAGVPGRVGGALRMNAGTHDEEGKTHSFSDVVRSVTVMDREGQVRELSKERVGFGYRSTHLEGQTVLKVTLGLIPDDAQAIDQRVKRLWAFKRKTQDWTAPSAGCIFKNPSQGQAAGWMIERAGLKGHGIGGAAISAVHANFIMNLGNARAQDVLGLIEEVQTRVKRLFGVELELELQVVPV